MRNLVVQALCKITPNTTKREEQVPLQNDVYELYQQIQAESYYTHKKNIQGDWEYVLLEKDVNHPFEIFQNTFKRVAELWKEGDTNILFFGLDTITVKPVDIFGKYEDFMMFNYTDPKSNGIYKNNFNCDVRYYPASMDEALIDYSLEEQSKLQKWEDEQNIYNYMLWQQPNRTLENTVDPTLAYQGHMLFTHTTHRQLEESNKWNNCQFDDAKIIHLHGSRSAKEKLQLIQIWKKHYGI